MKLLKAMDLLATLIYIYKIYKKISFLYQIIPHSQLQAGHF